MKNKTNNIFTLSGVNNSNTILNSDKVKINSVFILKNSVAYKNLEIIQKVQKFKSVFKLLDKYEFQKKCRKFSFERTQGIIVNFIYNFDLDIPDYSSKNICLILPERIEDPQNLGQIIRTSECAGIDGILLSETKTVGITNTVLQVSQGAFLNLPIYKIGNIGQTINNLKKQGFWVIGVENSIDAKKWYEIDMLGKVLLVFGSEGKGIRTSTIQKCDFLATIPMSGNVNSLNVSACVSAILFERNRQILKNKLQTDTNLS